AGTCVDPYVPARCDGTWVQCSPDRAMGCILRDLLGQPCDVSSPPPPGTPKIQPSRPVPMAAGARFPLIPMKCQRGSQGHCRWVEWNGAAPDAYLSAHFLGKKCKTPNCQ